MTVDAELAELADAAIVGPTPTRPAFVRPAARGDEALLRTLRDRALEDIASARGGAMYLERDAPEWPILQADWSGVAARVWLGGLQDVAFGYLIGSIAPLPSGGSLGVIEAIFVERGARACGIGQAMMTEALDWFRGHGCVGVEANALPGDRATKNFFEEHGLKARLLTVYQPLTNGWSVDGAQPAGG